MASGLLVLILAVSLMPSPLPQPGGAQWVPFAADLKVTSPGKPDTFGKFLQDEHGCSRREMVDPDGSPQIVINNYETNRVYHLFRGNWSSKVIVAAPLRRPPIYRGTGRKLDPIDGFDVYESEITVRSPQGDRKDIQWIVPALNSLVVRRPMTGGRVETVTAIRPGPQSAQEFLPPPTANVQETQAWGGGMLVAVVLKIAFDGDLPPAEAVTTEERPYTMRTPSADTFALVTSILDDPKGLVRVRIIRNPKGAPFNVQGDDLDRVEIALGESARTTRLPENFTITLRRIGSRIARQ